MWMPRQLSYPSYGVLLAGLFVLFASGCADTPADEEEALDNPFLSNMSNDGKEDTGYVNPDGIEVEVDLEADVQAPSYRLFDAPAELGQYALTYLRKRGQFYLESLAEDATSDNRVEWLVDEVWLTAEQARSVDQSKLTHFRIRGINAVLLFSAATDAQVGQTFTAKVPLNPYTAMSEGGENCIDPDAHMGMSSSIYWYLWNPTKSACTMQTQEMQIIISAVLPPKKTTYPEYDLLVADHEISVVILFGQIGDDPLTDSDSGVRNMKRMADWLLDADFSEVTPAPLGRRFTKTVAQVAIIIDLYSPYDFSGLSDMSHFSNFEKAIKEHEIIAYDGHSMLGASDFWGRPDYPDFYQIFLYGGCLGYEYYVRPILEGKGGWDKVDIVSSVVEVSASANYYAAPFIAKVVWALEHDYAASWKDLLAVIRDRVGDSTFGVSGAQTNCFSPAGSLCETPEPSDVLRFENTTAQSIPDNASEGIQSTIEVTDSMTIRSLSLELHITHTWVGDLTVTLSHAGTTVNVWEKSGGSNDNIDQTFALDGFAGVDATGTWTLSVSDTAQQDVGTLNSWILLVESE